MSAYTLPADLDGRRAAARDVPRPAAHVAGRTGGRRRRPARPRSDLLLRFRALPARHQVGPAQQGRHVALPDEVREGPEFFGKLTASPSSSHQLTFSHRDHPVDVDYNGLTSDYAPSAATTSATAAAASRRSTGPTSTARAARSTSATSGRARSTRTCPVTVARAAAAVRPGAPGGDGPVHRPRAGQSDHRRPRVHQRAELSPPRGARRRSGSTSASAAPATC